MGNEAVEFVFPPELENLSPGQKVHRLRRIDNAWTLTGRHDQQPPAGDWRTWLIMGGRGSGKTR